MQKNNQIESFELNDYKCDEYKHYCIEASAGTGKTYSIVEIVKKMLDSGVRLEEILLVTYTDKAAGELKNRIREGIDELNKNRLNNGKNAIDTDIDNSSICTIHSFCQSVIKEYCVASNQPLNLNVIDENEIADFLKKYIRDNDDIYKDLSNFKKISNNNSEIKIDEGKIIKYFKSGIEKYYLDSDGKPDDTVIVFEPYDLSEKAINDQIEKIKRINNDLAKEFVEEYEKVKEYDFYYLSLDKTKFNKVTDKDLNFSKEEKETFNSVRSFFVDLRDKIKPEGILFYKYHDKVYKEWQRYKEHKKIQTFNDMIRYVREEVIKENSELCEKLANKYRYAIIDEFQDTNRKQWDIFKKIFFRENHQLIVVGDPKQSIYAFQGADLNVYKQAKSEIEDGGNLRRLERNYRSSENMIEACNEVFEKLKVEKKIDREIKIYSLPDFTKSYFPTKEQGGKNKNCEIDGKEEKSPIKIVLDNNQTIDEYAYADTIVSEIVRLCEFKNGCTRLRITNEKDDSKLRNVSFKDFAVIARTRPQMESIETKMKQAGIPFLRYKDESLFNGRECKSWIALLDAINVVDFTGRNRDKLRMALFTDFFGYTAKEIRSDYFERDDIYEIQLIQDWKALASLSKWEDFVDSILVNSNIESKLGSLSDIQVIANYKQIGEYIVGYLSNNHNISEVINQLSLLSKDKGDDSEDEEDGLNISGKATNYDCVQVMTIHASKGLEFPIVIFVDGFKGRNDIHKPFIYYDSVNKTNLLCLSENYKKGKQNDNFEELIRLYYVAFTRAKYLLYIPHPNVNSGVCQVRVSEPMIEMSRTCDYIECKDIERELKDPKKLDKLKQKVKEIVSQLKNDETESETKESQSACIKKLKEGCKDKVSYKHSYSSLSHGHKDVVLNVSDEDVINKEGIQNDENLKEWDMTSIQVDCDYDDSISPMDIPSGFPSGAKCGTALHEVLELLDYSNYTLEGLNRLIKTCFNKQRYSLDDKEDWLDYIKELVFNVLNANFPIIKGSKKLSQSFKLKDITLNNKKAELEFNFNVKNEKFKNYCNGFIDLIIRRGDYYSIIDWKSDRLNNEYLFSFNDKEHLREHTDCRYSIQRVLYAYCLIKWLKNFYSDETEEEIFNNHFGGVYYVYVRGCNDSTGNGIYAQTWDSWYSLNKAFNNIINEKMGGFK